MRNLIRVKRLRPSTRGAWVGGAVVFVGYLLLGGVPIWLLLAGLVAATLIDLAVPGPPRRKRPNGYEVSVEQEDDELR